MMLLSLILFLLGVGYLYQWNAGRRDSLKFPPPGKLVKTAHGDLHLYCQGQGDVTVILEAGQGDCSLDWTAVHRAAAQFTRVCAYDRAGLGWSSPAAKVQSSQQIADTLHQALQSAGIAGPYVFAGHSVGGIYARAFAQQYPDEVTGLVLVDSAHENQRNRLPPFILKQGGMIKGLVTVFRVLAPFGVARALKLADRLQGDEYPDDVRAAAMARMYQTHFFKALSNEVKAGELNTAQTAPPAPIGDMPLLVLSQGERNPGLSEEKFEQLKQCWDELQQELVDLSTNSRHITAVESGHYIQHDHPQLVVGAIREVIQASQNGGQWEPLA